MKHVSLSDHDWVVAERHKLIPSVYFGIEIKSITPRNLHAIVYSGPIFIKIRQRERQSLSTANTHTQDFEALLHVDQFQSLVKTNVGSVKSVVIMIVDRGLDN